MIGFWLIPLAWLGVVAGVLFCYRRELLAAWREPVLRRPVLIVESDDWGAGPVEAQARALHRIVDVLTRHRDCTGRHPVMTLAMVLAVPDGEAVRCDGQYHRQLLDDPTFAPVREAIERGRAAGVFALQLHGLEHYWPAALTASTDPQVRDWLAAETPGTTERLPPHLQSRWVDASELPSSPLAAPLVGQAVREEVRVFERVFGERPRVAVPPTFVWTADVERAWAQEGVECVVTPGWRYTCRNLHGLPDCEEGPIVNGDVDHGVMHLVRYGYFEPMRGRDAVHALRELDAAIRQARPCLLENHRNNFMEDPQACEYSVAELEALFRNALERFDGVRFLSSLELGRILGVRDPEWIELRFGRRMRIFSQRLRVSRRFWRLALLTGLAGVMSLLFLLTPGAVNRKAV